MKAARILLCEDSAQDVELTLNALAGHNISNSVEVARGEVRRAASHHPGRGAHLLARGAGA